MDRITKKDPIILETANPVLEQDSQNEDDSWFGADTNCLSNSK